MGRDDRRRDDRRRDPKLSWENIKNETYRGDNE